MLGSSSIYAGDPVTELRHLGASTQQFTFHRALFREKSSIYSYDVSRRKGRIQAIFRLSHSRMEVSDEQR